MGATLADAIKLGLEFDFTIFLMICNSAYIYHISAPTITHSKIMYLLVVVFRMCSKFTVDLEVCVSLMKKPEFSIPVYQSASTLNRRLVVTHSALLSGIVASIQQSLVSNRSQNNGFSVKAPEFAERFLSFCPFLFSACPSSIYNF